MRRPPRVSVDAMGKAEGCLSCRETRPLGMAGHVDQLGGRGRASWSRDTLPQTVQGNPGSRLAPHLGSVVSALDASTPS